MTHLFWTRVSAITAGVSVLIITVIGLLSGWIQPFCETNDCAPPIGFVLFPPVGFVLFPVIVSSGIFMIAVGILLREPEVVK
jgi:hypothetical protein